MNSDGVHKQAIKRAFADKYNDERIAIYWGRGDNMIHVIASLNHYTHKIASEQGNALEFAAANGDRISVALTDDERRQLERAGF